jgi:MFS transporter, DHA1 family, multidrug resistance protein
MKTQSNTRQLLSLFLASFTVLFVGMGLFPLLPLYASSLGMDSAGVGIAFALMHAANTAGHLSVGALAARINPRRLFIAASLLGVPALALAGLMPNFWLVAVLLSGVWCIGGLNLALVSIFTGLISGGGSRGRSFGLMGLAVPLGSVVGGVSIGQLVAWQGYAVMFLVLSGVWAMLVLIGLFGLKDGAISGKSRTAAAVSDRKAWGFFPLLVTASLVAGLGIAFTRLGIPLSMQAQEYQAAAVASTATVSGLVTIPVVLLFGSLADRFGRGKALGLSYTLAAAGAVVLASAGSLEQYWIASTLMLSAFATSGSMGSALATDILPKEKLGSGIAILSALNSAAGIAGFAGAGYLIAWLGPQVMFLVSALLPAVGLLFLSGMGRASTRLAQRQVAGAEARLDNTSDCLAC